MRNNMQHHSFANQCFSPDQISILFARGSAGLKSVVASYSTIEALDDKAMPKQL
jgi:hypothetical protein